MVNRFAVLWLVLGVIAGYLAAGAPTKAQTGAVFTPSVLTSGSTVRLRFEQGTYDNTGASLNCIVGDVQAHWVRCKSADSMQDDREQRWYSLERVIMITRQEK